MRCIVGSECFRALRKQKAAAYMHYRRRPAGRHLSAALCKHDSKSKLTGIYMALYRSYSSAADPVFLTTKSLTMRSLVCDIFRHSASVNTVV